MKEIKIIWTRWLALGKKVANFQGRVLLTIFYVVFLAPTAFFMNFFADPLNLKKTSKSTFSNWENKSETLEDSKSQ